MGRSRTRHSCRDCGQQLAQWAGRCPGCGGWGTIEARSGGAVSSPVDVQTLAHEPEDERRVSAGFAGIDRVLGGGLVPGGVTLLAGEPGI
ncbi:MAG: DNA repair protein RadA, partial [Actinomycetota bacterium]